MNLNWISKNRKILLLAALPVVIVVWWLFRPEKLFVNERVNEATPFSTMNQPEPVFTGKFQAHNEQTKGRATIYKSSDGKLELRLTDFATVAGDDLQVALSSGEDDMTKTREGKLLSDSQELGAVRPTEMEQRFAIPSGVNPSKLSSVVVFNSKLKQIIGLAKLEPF